MNAERSQFSIDPIIFRHRTSISARFSDLDPHGHINNIAVAEIFSEARATFVRHMFAERERPAGFHFVVGQVAIRYLDEASWPDLITIGTGILDIGTKSMRVGQAFFMGGTCRAVAETALVAREHQHTVVLDTAMRQHLEAYRLPDEALPRLLR